jgi:hypothetical protein
MPTRVFNSNISPDLGIVNLSVAPLLPNPKPNPWGLADLGAEKREEEEEDGTKGFGAVPIRLKGVKRHFSLSSCSVVTNVLAVLMTAPSSSFFHSLSLSLTQSPNIFSLFLFLCLSLPSLKLSYSLMFLR